MQTQNRLFDDMARVASSAFNTLGGLKEEVELRVRERVERIAAEMDLVTREEFDAVADMAANARREQEDMAKKIQELEARIAGLTAKSAPRKRTASKAKSTQAEG